MQTPQASPSETADGRAFSYAWEDPYALADELIKRPVLDGLRAILHGELPSTPMEGLLGFRPLSFDPGIVVLEAEPSQRLMTHRGTVNGGWCLTLIYVAAATAIETTLDPGYVIMVVSQDAHLLRHVLAGHGPVVVTGRVRHRGRKLATAHAEVRDRASDKLIAEGTVTAMVQTIHELPGGR